VRLSRFCSADHKVSFCRLVSAISFRVLPGGAVSSDWWEGPYYGLEEGFVLIKIKEDKFEWEYINFGWEVQKGGN